MAEAATGLTLRRATPADTAQVDALMARSYPALLRADYPPSVLVTAVPIIARANPALLRCPSYFVAETAAGGIVGAGGWTPTRGGGRGDVRHVVTDHRLTRRGIGRALMTHAIDSARDAGVVVLDCLSTRGAVPFYAALGFGVVGPTEITLAPGILFPAVRMQRRLA